MSLEYILFKSLYHKGKEGFRNLAPNEFRMSGFADCSWELFFDKIDPPMESEGEPVLIKDKHTKVVTPIQGKAVAGTLLHESLQALLKPFILEAERKISVVLKSPEFPEIDVLLSGHVDIDYAEDDQRVVVRFPSPISGEGKRTLCDIKSLSTKNFEEITGIDTMAPSSYSAQKVKKAIPQANAYAVMSKADDFTILWIDKDSLRFKLESFQIDFDIFRKGISKMADVLNCANKYNNGDKEIRPAFCGITMCNYCRAYRHYCLGSTKLKAAGLV